MVPQVALHDFVVGIGHPLVGLRLFILGVKVLVSAGNRHLGLQWRQVLIDDDFVFAFKTRRAF